MRVKCTASTTSFHNHTVYFLVDGSGIHQVRRQLNKTQLLSDLITSVEFTECFRVVHGWSC